MSWDEGISRKSPNIFLQPIGNPQSIAPQSEAEKLQKQLDVEVAHLTPAIQRFWQVVEFLFFNKFGSLLTVISRDRPNFHLDQDV